MTKTALALSRTIALLLVLTWFFTGYHVVLPSDDIMQIQAIRKQHLGLTDPIIVVPSWVQRYNAASPAERRKMSESYIMRRLEETGMVVER